MGERDPNLTIAITVTYGYPVTVNVPPCNDQRQNGIIREERYGEKYD